MTPREDPTIEITIDDITPEMVRAWLDSMPKVKVSTVKEITLKTIDGIEYVKVLFNDGNEVNLRGPRKGMKIDKWVEDGVHRMSIEFHGFEPVD